MILLKWPIGESSHKKFDLNEKYSKYIISNSKLSMVIETEIKNKKLILFVKIWLFNFVHIFIF
jgi:hypothetical protein